MRAALLLLFLCSLCLAQKGGVPIPRAGGNGDVTRPETEGDHADWVWKNEAVERQWEAKLKRDTDRMAELSNQLKEYVSSGASKNTLPVNMLKASEELQKLAKTVNQELKGSSAPHPDRCLECLPTARRR